MTKRIRLAPWSNTNRVAIRLPDGIQHFDGFRLANLGVCSYDRVLKPEHASWHLTHQPSGLGFCHAFPTERKAKAAARKILAIVTPEELDLLATDDPAAIEQAKASDLRGQILNICRPLTQ